jgi:hypothetical protein
MFAILCALVIFVADIFKSRRMLKAENLLLRHQVNIALRPGPARIKPGTIIPPSTQRRSSHFQRNCSGLSCCLHLKKGAIFIAPFCSMPPSFRF